MSAEKRCECCNGVMSREFGVTNYNWNRRRFCSEKCRKKDERVRLMEGNRGGNSKRYHNSPITIDEARQFVELVKSGVSNRKAIKQVGRACVETMLARAVEFGLLERREPVARPVDAAPKITRVFPLPKGSDLTWGEMMPDIS